eukprot:8215209-Alexandrium_andersonii.AAC.1
MVRLKEVGVRRKVDDLDYTSRDGKGIAGMDLPSRNLLSALVVCEGPVLLCGSPPKGLLNTFLLAKVARVAGDGFVFDPRRFQQQRFPTIA